MAGHRHHQFWCDATQKRTYLGITRDAVFLSQSIVGVHAEEYSSVIGGPGTAGAVKFMWGCVAPSRVQEALTRSVQEYNVRRAPICQDPCYRNLLWVIRYVRTKTVEDATVVLIGTPNDIRGCHERLDREKYIRDRLMEECSFELSELFCVYVFSGT
jgi:hypothetical protein